MKNEKVLPLKREGWDMHDVLVHSYYNAEFTDNFGPFIKGEKFSSVTVDYGKGIVEGYNETGDKVVKSVNVVFKLR